MAGFPWTLMRSLAVAVLALSFSSTVPTLHGVETGPCDFISILVPENPTLTSQFELLSAEKRAIRACATWSKANGFPATIATRANAHPVELYWARGVVRAFTRLGCTTKEVYQKGTCSVVRFADDSTGQTYEYSVRIYTEH